MLKPNQQLGLLQYNLGDSGCSFEKALLLFKEGLLSFNPTIKKELSNLELEETMFLKTLYFNAGVPLNFVREMLSKLDNPYVYSLNEIYWDFAAKKWKYILEEIDKYIEKNIQEIIEDNFSSFLDEKNEVQDIAKLEDMRVKIKDRIEEIY